VICRVRRRHIDFDFVDGLRWRLLVMPRVGYCRCRSRARLNLYPFLLVMVVREMVMGCERRKKIFKIFAK
jgi:hypothetical protein